MTYTRREIKIWLTPAAAELLVPKVFESSVLDAILWEEDHLGFWVEVGSVSRTDDGGRRLRLVRSDYVASVQKEFEEQLQATEE